MNKFKIVGTFQHSTLRVLDNVHEVEVINNDLVRNTALVVITAYFPNLIGLAVFFENNCPNSEITSITKC